MLYSESGQWARHYSTVRLTLFTFFVTLSGGIISFTSSNHAQFVVAIFADFLLGIMVLLVYVFSVAYDKRDWQQHKNFKVIMGIGTGLRKPTLWSPFGHLPIWFALVVVAVMVGAQWWLICCVGAYGAEYGICSCKSDTIQVPIKVLPATAPTERP